MQVNGEERRENIDVIRNEKKGEKLHSLSPFKFIL